MLNCRARAIRREDLWRLRRFLRTAQASGQLSSSDMLYISDGLEKSDRMNMFRQRPSNIAAFLHLHLHPAASHVQRVLLIFSMLSSCFSTLDGT